MGLSRRPDFDITAVTVGGGTLPVTEQVLGERPFSRLLRFARPGAEKRPLVTLTAPLSSNFAYVLRDTVLGLLPACDVHVIEWRDGREVPAATGSFGHDENIGDILYWQRQLPRPGHLLGLCQSVTPVFAAAALLAQADDPARPASTILISGPIDPRVNPSRVGGLIRSHDPDWLARHAVSTVVPPWPGAGRPVYSSEIQRQGLMAYLGRHMATGGELQRKALRDDGADPIRHPFTNHFLSLMDLPAEVFLDTMRLVFHEAALPRGRLTWCGLRVEPDALERTPLLTIEGEEDDIAGVGQTAAAHDLARRLPAALRGRHVQPGIGHFGAFHGAAWRRDIVPVISRFVATHDPTT